MTAAADPYASSLTQYLPVLRALAQALVSCRKEFTVMNLDGIYRCISEQEQLCRQALALRGAIQAMPSSRLPGASDSHEVASLLADVARAEAEVQFLNRVQAAYLRRGNRTVNILLNALGAPDPAAVGMAAPVPVSRTIAAE